MDSNQYQTVLINNNIGFTVKNNGNHLIVEGDKGFIDVWPTTGKWIDRMTTTQGFGLRELVNFITKGESLTVVKPPISISLKHSTAVWLRGVMQNPLWSSPEAEPEEDSQARAEVFKAVEHVQP